MPVFFVDPKGELFAFCDRCAAEPETEEARKRHKWQEIRLDVRDERRQEAKLWYCQACGELLEDVPPVLLRMFSGDVDDVGPDG